MVNVEKLKAKLLARPTEALISDVQAIFEAEGWTLRSIKGSHHIFENKAKGLTYSVPTVGGRKVKRHYLDAICDILDLKED